MSSSNQNNHKIEESGDTESLYDRILQIEKDAAKKSSEMFYTHIEPTLTSSLNKTSTSLQSFKSTVDSHVRPIDFNTAIIIE